MTEHNGAELIPAKFRQGMGGAATIAADAGIEIGP